MALRRLGRFPIEGEIARGGAGVVFRGRHSTTGVPVALKLLLGWTPKAVKRLHTEAQAMSRLRHPNIVSVHEVAEHEGQPFLVLDFVEGQSLDRRLERGPLSSGRAAELVRDVANAVAHAHRHGVLHRDLKPANVLLRPSGEVLLTDFGLAKVVDAPTQLSVSGIALGTPGYWPPEQARGDLGAVDARADVYGLGSILFAALTGRPPFIVTSLVEAMIAANDQPPTPPSELVPNVDPRLDAICLKALAKEPSARFATAGELSAALEQVLAGEAPPPTAGVWRRRALVLCAVMAAVASLSAIGLRSAAAARLRAVSERAAARDARAWLAAALARMETDPAEARRRLSTAQDLDPELAEITFWFGRLSIADKDWLAADRFLTRAIERGLRHSEAYYYRGYARFQSGRLSLALADFDRYIAACPNDPTGHLNRGATRIRLGDFEGALLDLGNSLARDPRSSTALATRAWALLQLGRPKRALADSRAALELDPVNAPALFHAGMALAELDRSDEAERDFDRALTLDGQHVDLWLARGQLRLLRGAHREALSDFEQALRLAPNSGLGYANRATARAKLGDLQGALRDYERARAHPTPHFDLQRLARSEQRVRALLRQQR